MPAGVELARKENEGENDRADLAGETGFDEIDPAGAVRAGKHADHEKEEQRRDPEATGDFPRENSSQKEQSDDKEGGDRRH
ncbi:hypothetical protein BH18ACT5_BH18ACT5_08170 [soil metagenome]